MPCGTNGAANRPLAQLWKAEDGTYSVVVTTKSVIETPRVGLSKRDRIFSAVARPPQSLMNF
jgi:hypothetical protein